MCLNLLLPVIDQYLTRRDRDLVDYCTERLARVRAGVVGVSGTVWARVVGVGGTVWARVVGVSGMDVG